MPEKQAKSSKAESKAEQQGSIKEPGIGARTTSVPEPGRQETASDRTTSVPEPAKPGSREAARGKPVPPANTETAQENPGTTEKPPGATSSPEPGRREAAPANTQTAPASADTARGKPAAPTNKEAAQENPGTTEKPPGATSAPETGRRKAAPANTTSVPNPGRQNGAPENRATGNLKNSSVTQRVNTAGEKAAAGNLKTPPVDWPGGARCCVCLTFDLDAEWVILGEDPDTARKPRRLSLGQYVWRAGAVGRILDLLDQFGVKSTFFVPAVNALNHPEVLEDIIRRGHEVGCHGYQHEAVTDLEEEEERKRLRKTLEILERITGKRPRGHRLAGDEPSPNTFRLLKEEGILYDSSLRDSDLPYLLPLANCRTDKPFLVEIPSYYEMDDFHLFADYPGIEGYEARIQSTSAAYDIWTNAFDGYYRYGLCYTTMFHPQIIGKPGYLLLMEKLLQYIKSHSGVWFAKAGEIADFWIAQGGM